MYEFRLVLLLSSALLAFGFHLGQVHTGSYISISKHRLGQSTIESTALRATPDDGDCVQSNNLYTRRSYFLTTRNALAGMFTLIGGFGNEATAIEEDDEDLEEMYENPEIPTAPEERSGLVVLRVAEVAQFQEKILRAIVDGDLEGVMVSPMQFVFGTQILLRNSNLDGNMRLMIDQEISRKYRKRAVKNCVNALNRLQDISAYAGAIKRDFKSEEMIELADMYRDVRINLNQLYEYLPEREKDKYYGYFVAVTAYEKKIAEGTYNPDIDGKLKFDY